MERRAAFHFDRRARVMGQHEHIGVIRRIVAPPALPPIVGPLAADGAEHIAAHDPRAYVLKPARREVIVGTRCSIFAFEGLPECARPLEPLMKCEPAAAEWILCTLVRTGSVAVEGNGKAMHAKFGHELTWF